MDIDDIPQFFASFSEMTLGWGVQELIRGAVCCAAMIPPALFIGAIFPIAIDCVGLAFPDRPIRMLGYASALNTLGNILGVLVAGFVLLPTIGPFASVKLLAGVCLLLGACAAIAARARRLWMLPALTAAAALLLGWRAGILSPAACCSSGCSCTMRDPRTSFTSSARHGRNFATSGCT